MKRFQKNQAIMTKGSKNLSSQYRKKAGIITKVKKEYLSVKFKGACQDIEVLREDVDIIL